MFLKGETIKDIEERMDSLIDSHRDFLEELISYRKNRGLSQKDVAFRMGVTQAAVSQFENHDANPTLSTIRRYAAAVGVRIQHAVMDDVELGSSYQRPVEPTRIAQRKVSWVPGQNIKGLQSA